MKTTNDNTETKVQLLRGITVPMFLPTSVEQPMANDVTTPKENAVQQAAVSLFDVKELYDLAYAEKAKGTEGVNAFKKILAEAVKLDLAYRRQLSKNSAYKDHTELKNFNNATEASTTSSKVA